jgi:fido (protein-threonine AMPylation protein)
MATPAEKLAQSLEVLSKFQNTKGLAVIKANELSRINRERLITNGFIREVIKGWYISSRPEEQVGDSTSWYTSFWYFVSVYFNERFGEEWCLSSEQSLAIYSGNMSVPKQLLVKSPKSQNNIIALLHGTSFFDMASSIPSKDEIIKKDGINLYSLSAALINSSPYFFSQYPTDARAALSIVKDSSEILEKLLDGGHSKIAGRLAGAFRNIGRDRIADDIIQAMKSAGYDIRESDPFNDNLPSILNSREVSPYVNRIKLMWQKMRQTVIDNFPKSPGLPTDVDDYLKKVEEIYVTDAYHSLSIEGYRVTQELIEKVKTGQWSPDGNDKDKEHRNAMAARGYWQAFQAVKSSIKEILSGKNPGQIADNDHNTWYRELFAPSVAVGILKPSDLAGYRNDQVYIKGSMHTPLKPDALRDAIPTLFDLLKEEPEPSVRAVLGHFIFVYIHPYMDGNGRIGRFLMNVMLASGGYSWTVIPVESRDEYMIALEKASVEQDILPFTEFIAKQYQTHRV